MTRKEVFSWLLTSLINRQINTGPYVDRGGTPTLYFWRGVLLSNLQFAYGFLKSHGNHVSLDGVCLQSVYLCCNLVRLYSYAAPDTVTSYPVRISFRQYMAAWFALLCNIPFHQTMGKANSKLYMYCLGSPDKYSNYKSYITQCSSRTHMVHISQRIYELITDILWKWFLS